MNLKAILSKAVRKRPPARPSDASCDDSSILKQVTNDKLFTIVDIGAQNLAFERHVYSPLCIPGVNYRIIGFEPLENRANERNSSEDKRTIIFPFAIGDGGTHKLYINNDDATSSLFPLNEPFCADFEHLHTLKPTSTVCLETRRLDDSLPPESVEFLKLDIQGAELLALQSAANVLKRTAVIHCEVEFDEIYLGQPLFHDVQKFLLDSGFYLLDLIISHRYAYENSKGLDARDRLIWADAVYFQRTQVREILEAQAVIAALVYQKPTLAAHLLDRRDRLS
jgi:FkbM family methyltransferase